MVKTKRHFSDLTYDEVYDMVVAAQHGAIDSAKKANMSGLSHLGSHNLYQAIENGIFEEWEKSRKVWKKPKRAKKVNNWSIYDPWEDISNQCELILMDSGLFYSDKYAVKLKYKNIYIDGDNRGDFKIDGMKVFRKKETT